MIENFYSVNLDEWAPAPFMENVPTLYPTKIDIKNFDQYMKNAIKDIDTSCGILKIIPPKEWSAKTKQNPRITFEPVRQRRSGKNGIYFLNNEEVETIKFEKFKDNAIKEDKKFLRTTSTRKFERDYWKFATSKSPLYAVDIRYSLFDSRLENLNLAKLKTLLDTIPDKIEGVHKPYVYIGTSHSTFAFHTEDMNLYSISYLHFGKPKIWYSIPQSHVVHFEILAKNFFPRSYHQCPAFLRHKNVLIAPFILDFYKIPYVRVVQNPGEFIVTLPSAYHQGYNMGFNCAESVNFALPNWIPYGIIAPKCFCEKGRLNLDMTIFKETATSLSLPVDWRNYKSFEYSPSEDIIIHKKTVFPFSNQIYFSFMDIVEVWFPFRNLISHGQLDRKSIMRINDYFSYIPPFCSYCQLFKFTTYKQPTTYIEGTYIDQTTFNRPDRSDVNNKLSVFYKHDRENVMPDLSAFAQCKICHAIVHKACIGIHDKKDYDNLKWTCDFCSDHPDGTIPTCAYCPVNIGILSKMKDNKYAHMACKVLGEEHFRKKCTYCSDITTKEQRMVCCSNCSKRFHLYCGHYNDAFYTLLNWPHMMEVHCKSCRSEHDKNYLIPIGHLVQVNMDDEFVQGTIIAYRNPHAAMYDNFNVGYDVDQDDIVNAKDLETGNDNIKVTFQNKTCAAKYIGKMTYVCYVVLLNSGQKYLFTPDEVEISDEPQFKKANIMD